MNAWDGQSLSDQDQATQDLFRRVHGDNAASQWASEHNSSLRSQGWTGPNQPPTQGPPGTFGSPTLPGTQQEAGEVDVPLTSPPGDVRVLERDGETVGESQLTAPPVPVSDPAVDAVARVADEERKYRAAELALRQAEIDANLRLQSQRAATNLFGQLTSPHATYASLFYGSPYGGNVPLPPGLTSLAGGLGQFGAPSGFIRNDPQSIAALFNQITRQATPSQLNSLSGNVQGQLGALAQLAGQAPQALFERFEQARPRAAHLYPGGPTIF